MDKDSISFNPRICENQPHIGINTVPVKDICVYVWEGYSSHDLQLLMPGLTHFNILYSCWFAARHGGNPWKTRWKDWANHIEPKLLVDNKIDELAIAPSRKNVLGTPALFVLDRYLTFKSKLLDRNQT